MKDFENSGNMRAEQKADPIGNRANSRRMNFVLGAGFALLLMGVALGLMKAFRDNGGNTFVPITSLALGEIFLYSSFVYKRKTYSIALGFMFVFDGILFAIINSGLVEFGMRELWPVIVINSALSLIPADLFIYRRIRTVFLFPAIMLFLMGLIFLLFSTHVFSFSFAKFIAVFWPLVLVFFGIVLVGVYVFQQMKVKEFPYMQDDSVTNLEDDAEDFI